MPRKYYKKKRVGRKKLYRRRRTTRSIVSRVKRLERVNRRKTQTHIVQMRPSQNLVSDYNSINLSNWSPVSGYQPMFGTVEDDLKDANSFYHKSMGIDMYYYLNNETENITYTVFLVSLKDQIGSAFNPSTGALSLTADVHYVKNTSAAGYGGLVMLNKGCFNIHKIARFTLGNNGQVASTSSGKLQYGVDRRMYWKWKPRCLVRNPIGNVRGQLSSVDPSKCYYLLIFNDNSVLDAQAQSVQINVVSTIEVNE